MSGIGQDLVTGKITIWPNGTRLTLSESAAKRLLEELQYVLRGTPTQHAVRAYRNMQMEAALND